MQPPRSKHARSLHALVVGAFLIGGLLGLQGCTSSDEPPTAVFSAADTLTSTVGRDSALQVLSSMQRTAFDSAFAELDRYTVTRSVRTEQFDSTGTVTALRSYVLRYPPAPDPGRIQQRDSAGQFRGGGLLGAVAPAQSPTDRPANVGAQILPDQPAYVEPRTREAYRYALRADTLRSGRSVYVVEARARNQGPGRRQSIRHARLLLDRTSRALVGLTTIRADEGLLFSEHSRLVLRLRLLGDGTWVPHVTRVRAFLHVPFRAPRHFRTVSAFYDYRS